MNRFFKKQVWQAILRDRIICIMKTPMRRAYARFVFNQYLPAVEALCDEPANFANIIQAAYAYHHLMRDGGVLQQLTDRYDGKPIGGSWEEHLKCLTNIHAEDIQMMKPAFDDPAGYLAKRNVTEREVLRELRLIDSDADDAINGKLTIGRLLATRPQIIMTTFCVFFTSGSRMRL